MRESLELQHVPIPQIAHMSPSFEGKNLTDEIPEIKTVLTDTTEAIGDEQKLKSKLKTSLAQMLIKRFMDNCVC